MAAAKSGIQVVKSSNGDVMLLVPVDKRTAAQLGKQDVALGIYAAKELGPIKIKCLARYDQFKLREDLVVNPIAVLVK